MAGESGEIVKCPGCGRRNRVPPAAAGSPRCPACKTALPWIANADQSSFAKIAERSPLVVIVDLWAPWCGPCRQISPALEQIAIELAGKMKLVKVNVDDSPALSQRFGVQGIPTLLALHRGKVVDKVVGARPKEALRAWADRSIAKALADEPTSRP